MPTERGLTDFAGLWTLDRAISHASGPEGQFKGQAQFSWRGDGLDYVEEGTLTLGASAPLTATQRYRWAPGLTVYFEDGRLFHQVPPGGGAASHWCAPDQYDGRYDFTDWPRFTVTWTVKGPRKDYRMVSRYARSMRGSVSNTAAFGQ